MKEDVDTLKDDWLTDNVCGEPIITRRTQLSSFRSSRSGKSTSMYIS